MFEENGEKLLELIKKLFTINGSGAEAEIVIDQVRNLPPNVDLNYSDPADGRNCLHWLALARPSRINLIIANNICERLLKDEQQRNVDSGCLYSLSRAQNDATMLAARYKIQVADENSDDCQKLQQSLVELLLETDQKLAKKYAEELNQKRLFESAVISGNVRLLTMLAKRFRWSTDDSSNNSFLTQLRTQEGCSLPQIAAAQGHTHLLEWFNEGDTWHSVPLNLEDRDGEIPLTDAAAKGHSESVKYLIEHGNSSVDHRSRIGDTPLFRALKNEKFSVANILLDLGANATLTDFGGNTVLHAIMQMPEGSDEETVRKRQCEETVRKYKKILKENFDISQFCSENLLRYLPLHTCVAEKNWPALEAAIEVLSDQGDINRFMTNSCGVNVLHIFFSFHYDKEDRKTVKRCLGNAKEDRKTVKQCLGNAKEDRKTVKQCLGNAKEDRKTVKRCLGNALWNKLLKERASRGHRHGGGFRDGFTCLHFACEFNNINALDYLVKSGLQISDRTANGKTGIDLLLNHYDTESIIVDFFKYIRIPMENDQKSDLHLKELYLYSLIDPVRAARIEQNPRESLHHLARKLQRLCHSEQEQSELLRFPIASLDGFISGRLTLAKNSRQHQRQIPLGVQLLARCLESDDSEGVAQLAALGLLDSMWQKEFCKDFRATQKNTEEPEIDIVEYCMEQKKYKVCQEILRYRQFDLVPTCLRVLIKCKKQGDEPHHREALKLLKNAAKNILLNALNALECPPSSGPVGENNTLVMNYIERTHGPSFQEFGEPQGQNVSVAQLLESSGEEEVFSTGSVRQLVSDSWKGQKDSVCAPRTKFFFNLATHFAFTVLLSVFITMGESCYSLKTAGGLLIYILLWPFALDFIVIDLLSISTFQKDTKPGRIVKWTFGFLGSLLLLAGLIGVLFAEFYSPQVQDGVHMCLATAYLIMVIRLLGFFRWLNFGNIGPTVGIIERLLLNDLLPFLLIFLIFIVAFGVFFQVLLHPGRQVYSFSSGQPQSQGVGEAIVGVYARPLLLAFGELEIDSLRSCLSGQNCSDLKDSDCTCPHALGARLYLALFAFVFLILNLALLNLLIAKFNLTVNTGVRQAFVTWNCYRYQMLRQFQWLPPVPLPFRWFGIAARRCGCHLRCNKVEPRLSYIVQTSNQELINDENYNKFLKFQAQRFRGRRPAMIKPVEFKENDDVN